VREEFFFQGASCHLIIHEADALLIHLQLYRGGTKNFLGPIEAVEQRLQAHCDPAEDLSQLHSKLTALARIKLMRRERLELYAGFEACISSFGQQLAQFFTAKLLINNDIDNISWEQEFIPGISRLFSGGLPYPGKRRSMVQDSSSTQGLFTR
jgi:hypothetical protein